MNSPRAARPAGTPSSAAPRDLPLRAVPSLVRTGIQGVHADRDDAEDYFDPQPASTSSLPNPMLLMENLARCVLEVLAGARELDQLARWVSDDVYRHLLKRVVLSARARQARGTPPGRPNFRVGNIVSCEPADGVIEGVVIIHGRARTRAVAIRLEGFDSRWRASAINVL